MTRHGKPVAVLVALALLVPARAWAQSPAAEALFQEGRTALAAGDLDTACARFRGSDKLDPQPGTRINLGNCEEKRGRVASAWEAFSSALSRLPKDDARGAFVHERLDALTPRLPRLLLVLAEGASRETTVREGATVLGIADTYGVALPLDPGIHHLAVLPPGSEAETVDVTLVEGETARLVVGAAAHGRDVARTPADTGAHRYGPWIVGGVGLASFAVSAVTGGLLLHAKSIVDAHCTNGPIPACRDQTGMDAASSVRTLGPATTTMLVLGSAGVASSAVWLGLRSGLKLGVAPSGTGAAWRVGGSW